MISKHIISQSSICMTFQQRHLNVLQVILTILSIYNQSDTLK